MAVHELKTWPKYYKPVQDGIKSFEIRKNDRDYQVGDMLILREYDPVTESYTGLFTRRLVTYILSDQPFVPEGYVIMGIKGLK